MAAVHKVHKKETEEREKPVETKSEETKTPSFAKAASFAEVASATKAESEGKEPVVVSDTVTETTERIEVIEETAPEPKSEAKTHSEAPAAAPSAASTDPLTYFKEKMNEEESLPSDTEPKKSFMWPILFIFIIALLMLGGIFAYKNNTRGEKINVITLSPTPTIMPQPTIALDLQKYPTQILNGSGVDGEAGRQKESLKTEGFVVSSIGNADNSYYKDTIIKAKKEVEKAFLDKLKSVLEKTFTVGEIRTLPDSASSSVVVILGTKK